MVASPREASHGATASLFRWRSWRSIAVPRRTAAMVLAAVGEPQPSPIDMVLLHTVAVVQGAPNFPFKVSENEATSGREVTERQSNKRERCERDGLDMGAELRTAVSNTSPAQRVRSAWSQCDVGRRDGTKLCLRSPHVARNVWQAGHNPI